MKAITLTAVLVALLALAMVPVRAAEMKDMPGMKQTPGVKTDAAKTAENQAHKGQGTVNGVDVKAGKVNLTHGPIAALKWPAMTMDFQVKDKALLNDVTPGQNVEFDIAQQGTGRFVITRIAPAAKKNCGKAAEAVDKGCR